MRSGFWRFMGRNCYYSLWHFLKNIVSRAGTVENVYVSKTLEHENVWMYVSCIVFQANWPNRGRGAEVTEFREFWKQNMDFAETRQCDGVVNFSKMTSFDFGIISLRHAIGRNSRLTSMKYDSWYYDRIGLYSFWSQLVQQEGVGGHRYLENFWNEKSCLTSLLKLATM